MPAQTWAREPSEPAKGDAWEPVVWERGARLPMAHADPTAAELARFRPRRRLLALAVGLNLALSLIFIVAPWVHGRLRAREAQRRFAQFAACIWDGEPTKEPGLGLPAGERERFADRVLHAPAEWPGRCRPRLNVVDGPSIALLPRVKEAEHQVRKAIRLVDRELQSLERARASHVGRVPDRPHRAIGRLRAALAILMETVGNDLDQSPAIRFDPKSTKVLLPTRIPLAVSEGAQLLWRPSATGLEIAALGGNRISRVRVADGGVLQSAAGRPGNAQALVGDAAAPFLIRATPEDQCRRDERRCQLRTTGISEVGFATTSTPRPWWLAGHPALRASEGLVHRADRWWLVARADDALEVRAFEVSEAPTETPIASIWQRSLPGTRWSDDACFLSNEIVFTRASVSGAGGLEIVASTLPASLPHGSTTVGQDLGAEDSDEALPLRVLAEVAAESAWLTACSTGGPYLAAVDSRRTTIVHVPSARSLASIDHPVGAKAPLAVGDPVQVVCDASRADIFLRTVDGALLWVACTAEGCLPEVSIAPEIRHVAAALSGAVTLVAYAGDASHAQVQTRRIVSGELFGPVLPAACWTLESGFCGQPYLNMYGDRWLLGARDGSDLLLLESTDGGRSFTPMRGLRESPP